MGTLYAESERQLAAILRRHAGRPRAAYTRLLLLALEREQIVTVAYREAVIATRLRSAPLPADARRLIEHACLWVWKDEEMHTVYVRGALLAAASGWAWTRTFAEQAGGAVGGWASAVLHHSRPGSAPVARAAARLITAAGRLAGKVPGEVGKALKYAPFRDFCRLNDELERSSVFCWRELLRLAGDDPAVTPEQRVEFLRVVEDEENHRRVFATIADCLTDDDRLAPGVTTAVLAERLGEIGRSFLPRPLRGVDDEEQPFGAGGRVWCVEGSPAEPAAAAFRRTLEACDLADRLRARAAALGKSVDQMRVVVKGSFMLGCHRGDPSPVVPAALVEELAAFLHALGVRRLTVADGQYLYDRFLANRSAESVARYFGYGSPRYELADLSADQLEHAYVRGLGVGRVGRAWAAADFRLGFGKLRSHPVDGVYLGVGNLEGVAGRTDEYLFADRAADRATALLACLNEFPVHYSLLDGYERIPDGLCGVMGCRRPRSPRRFYAGADALAVDGVAARHLGADPAGSTLLRAAAHWFGGWPAAEVVGTDAPVRGWRGPQSNDLWAILSLIALPVFVWGSRRGSLFLPAADERAFPPLTRPGPLTRLGRRITRAVLGLPSPASRDRKGAASETA